MTKFIGLPLFTLIGVLALGAAQHASAQTRVGVYLGAPAYSYTPQYAAPYSAYGYYDQAGWRDDHWRRERERERREHERRERERREHERHEHRDHDRW